MKLTSLNCPQCGGKIKKIDNQTMRCESCGTEFIVEKENPEINQTINHYYSGMQKDTTVSSNKNRTAKIIGRILLVLFIIAGGILYMYTNLKGNNRNIVSNSSTTLNSTKQQTVLRAPESPAMLDFLYQVFGKTADQLSSEELSEITYLDIQTTALTDDKEYWILSYSFDPYSLGSEPNTKTIYVPLDKKLEQLDTTCLSGLQYLNFNHEDKVSVDFEAHSPAGLNNLVYYGGYFNQLFSEIANDLTKKDMLKGLAVQLRTQEDVELLTNFSNLESLETFMLGEEITDYSPVYKLKKLSSLELRTDPADISWISGIPSIKNLTIDHAFKVKDYSVLYSLSNLEELTVQNGEALKEIGFVQNMPKLKRLNLEATNVQSLDPIRDKTSLLKLYLTGNQQVMDYSAVGTLTSLQELTINMYSTNQIPPSFNKLTLLKKLDVNSHFLNDIATNESVKEVSVIGGALDVLDYSAFAQVEKLKLSGVSIEQTRELLTLTSLRELILDDVEINDGENGHLIFGLPDLERLTMSNSGLRLPIELIEANTTLKKLELSGMQFYSDEGIIPYLSKIAMFTGLEELNLPDEQINDLGFVKNLSKLKELNLRDNYISDVAVLTGLPELTWVNLEGNPVTNAEVLENVLVVK